MSTTFTETLVVGVTWFLVQKGALESRYKSMT